MYDTDKIGATVWAATTGSDRSTRREAGTDRWDWDRPAEELGDTRFPAKFADRLLRGDGMSDCTSHSEGKCGREPDLSAPGLGYDDCCWVAATKAPELGSLAKWRGESIEYWTANLNRGCVDMLEPANCGGGSLQWAFAAFTDALPMDTSCKGSHAGMHV